MKPRDYCCCAIPIVNVGVYATLIEQFVVGVTVGILSFATPTIVGAATPSFAPWLFGVVCLVAGGLQVLGIFGVAKERPILFRRYLSLHSLAALAVFSIGTTWTIISATRHSTAKDKCIREYFDANNPDELEESKILCEIFPWVSVGIMGGLLVVLAIMHVYLFFVLSSYSKAQTKDRAKYDALGDGTSESIPMNSRPAWDSRPSEDQFTDQPKHYRQESSGSVSDMLSQPVRQPADGFKDFNDPYSYPNYSDVSQPGNAYTSDPGPTPRFTDAIYSGPSSSMDRPPTAQAHPAEGSFHRKTPRLTKDNNGPDF